MGKLAKFVVGRVVSSAVGGGLGGGLAGFAASQMVGALGSKGKERVLVPGGGNGVYSVDYNDGRGPQEVDTSAYRVKGDKGVYDLIPLMKGPTRITGGTPQEQVARARGKAPIYETADMRIKAALKDDPTALANYLKAHPDPAPRTAIEQAMGGRQSNTIQGILSPTDTKFGNVASGDIRDMAASAEDRKSRGLLDHGLQTALADYATGAKAPILLGSAAASEDSANAANAAIRKSVGLKTVLGG